MKDISFQTSPTFQNYTFTENKSIHVNDKINRINDKLNSYMTKNNLLHEEKRKIDYKRTILKD